MFIVIFSHEESKIEILQPLCLSYGNHDIFNLLLLQQLTLFWSSITVHWPQCAVRFLKLHLFVQTEVLVQIYWNLGCCPALEAENVVFVHNVFFPHSPGWWLKWAFRLNGSPCILGSSTSSKSCRLNIMDLECFLDLIYCQLAKTSEHWVWYWVKKENINKTLVFLIWSPLGFTLVCPSQSRWWGNGQHRWCTLLE